MVTIAVLRSSTNARHVEIIEKDKMASSGKIECPLFPAQLKKLTGVEEVTADKMPIPKGAKKIEPPKPKAKVEKK